MTLFIDGATNPIAMQTRRGTDIENSVRFGSDVAAFQEQEFFRTIQQLPHGAVRVRPADTSYNCFGLVFGSRRAWISPDQFEVIRDGDDLQNVSQQEVAIGDVAIYCDGETPVHAGLVVDRQGARPVVIRILSKWGKNGEYVHPPDAVLPGFAGVVTYWRPSDVRR